MSRVQAIIDAIIKARAYSEELFSHISPEDWFRQPSEGVTHVAWQIGHIAVAEYSLALRRIRGARPEDSEIVPAGFAELFGKGSTPSPDPGLYPSAEEIRGVFDGVHRQVLAELAVLPETVLDEPTDPHPLFATKQGALQWAPYHEVFHTGQCALLRRLLGHDPLR